MSRHVSIFPVTAACKLRSNAVETFTESGDIERCRDVIPGSSNISLMQWKHTPASAYLVLQWPDEKAGKDWMISPHRGVGKRVFDQPLYSFLFEGGYRAGRTFRVPALAPFAGSLPSYTSK